MYHDAFETKDCQVEGKSYSHGAESCDRDRRKCRICIDGWWIEKVRGNRGYC